jgi:hypothetical protein
MRAQTMNGAEDALSRYFFADRVPTIKAAIEAYRAMLMAITDPDAFATAFSKILRRYMLPHRCTDRRFREVQKKIFVKRARHHKPVLAGSVFQVGRNHFYSLAGEFRFIPIVRP